MNKILFPLVFLVLCIGSHAAVFPSYSNFVAVFGDSLSDTGNFDAVYPGALRPPYWNGRFSNGRVLLEHAMRELNVHGALSPYLWSTGSTYSHAINFAFAGATAVSNADNTKSLPASAPFFLGAQLNHFARFKKIVNTTYAPLFLPTQAQLRHGLFFIFSGGNDINYANWFVNKTETQLTHEVYPNVTQAIADAVQFLSDNGALRIVVVNLPPQGCSPFVLANQEAREGYVASNYDSYGCSIKYNNRSVEYNTALKNKLDSLSTVAEVIYADYYGAALEIYHNPEEHLLSRETMLNACCGAGRHYNCDTSTLTSCGGCDESTVCKTPEYYISWDGIHYTDAFNARLAHVLFRAKPEYLQPPHLLDDMLYGRA